MTTTNQDDTALRELAEDATRLLSDLDHAQTRGEFETIKERLDQVMGKIRTIMGNRFPDGNTWARMGPPDVVWENTAQSFSSMVEAHLGDADDQ